MGYIDELRKHVGKRLLMVPGGRAVLENDAGEVLLIRRRDFDVWALPGGSPNEGESAHDAIVREVYEETGFHLLSFTPIGFASDPEFEIVDYPNGDRVHGYALILYSNQWTGNLKLQQTEISDARFTDPHHLPQMLPNERRTVEKFLQYRKTGAFQLF